MKEKYPSITEDQCHDLFHSADEHKTGKIDFELFKKFFKNHPVYMELSKNFRKRRLEKEALDKEAQQRNELEQKELDDDFLRKRRQNVVS